MTTHLAKFLDHNETEPWEVLFRNFFDRDSFFLPAINSDLHYPVDIHETENALNIEIAIPGIDKGDVLIDECDGVLNVSYNKKEETDDSNKHYIKRGITRKSFNMGWKISDKFNLKNINAEMDKGLLKIIIPKSEEKKVIKNAIKIK